MRPRPGHRASVTRGRRRRRVRGVLRRSTGRAAPRGPRLVRGQAPQGRRGRRGPDAKEGGRVHHRRRAAGARQRVGRRPPRHLRAHLPRRLARALAQARIRAVPRALAPDRPRADRHPAPAPRPDPGQIRWASGVDARAAARGVHRAGRRRGGPRDGAHGVAAGVRRGGQGDPGPNRLGRGAGEGVCRGERGLAVARRSVRGARLAHLRETPPGPAILLGRREARWTRAGVGHGVGHGVAVGHGLVREARPNDGEGRDGFARVRRRRRRRWPSGGVPDGLPRGRRAGGERRGGVRVAGARQVARRGGVDV
mmetsp:Transcript_1471/g.6444  ORF Transcript_1471/g.6444 Transcript_1471/m.6444 type:complete len:310 (-) Transcript_1471:1898-2827(-)